MSKLIPLTKGQFAIVDDADYDLLMQWKWTYLQGRKTGYAVRYTKVDDKRVTVYMHRFIINASTGVEVDHKDRNGLNNTRNNIRIATPGQNRANAPKSNRKTTSRYKGVYRTNNPSRPWWAHIGIEGKSRTIGYFANELDAACAYNYAAVQHYGEFAYVNDIPGWDEQPCPQPDPRGPRKPIGVRRDRMPLFWWTAYLIAA